MVLNTTLNNISVISWWSVLKPPTCHKSLTKDLTMSNMVGIL